MEEKKANLTAALSILCLIILIVILRVTLELSKTFYLILGADIAVIFAIIALLLIRRHYSDARRLLESRWISEGKELRIEYSFLRKVAGVPIKFRTTGGRGGRNRRVGGGCLSWDLRKWQYFPKIVSEKLREGRIMEVVDPRLLDGHVDGGRTMIEEREVRRMVCVALWCIQERSTLRPNMHRVLEMLEGRVAIEEPPDTQMIVVDLLSVDDDQIDDHPEVADGRSRNAAVMLRAEGHSGDGHHVAAANSGSYSFAMSILSPR
ncbi:hypothetical protein SAY86_030254 [Trapa natans]|uniref:Uncharacterized protein n=1 Tax=Trapa natans TaxID=22666 RepID=A0AAN7RI86_TRANT|nr:hypothetical protein SAY86_030254 [Trapa natans]